jgi:hypothetical protein
MTENQNQPREYDSVLGGKSQVPLGAAVLGGIPGVKSRLASPILEAKIAALSEALKYGEAGLDLIIQALQDESLLVKFAAYSLLKNRNEEKIKQHLRTYSPIFDFDVITVDAYDFSFLKLDFRLPPPLPVYGGLNRNWSNEVRLRRLIQNLLMH